LKNKSAGIQNSILDTIGATPLVKLSIFSPENGATVAAKIESQNPGGSIKDRTAYSMINEAEKKHILKPGSTVVEPTSGNTGVGLAVICAVKGYKLILVMPASMSEERRRLFTAYGADFVLTPPELGMKGAIDKALELTNSNKDYFMPQQFENPANPLAHEKTTALEILEQTDGRLNAFVATIGTGGTLTGVARVLKKEVPNVKIIGVEPASSAVLSGNNAGPHKIQGIGAGFIPKTLDTSIIDRIITVSDDEAYKATQQLAKKEGILAGISSGAAAFAAHKVAKQYISNKLVVTILPDTGEMYISVKGLFSK
jgi:cysteine synthase A